MPGLFKNENEESTCGPNPMKYDYLRTSPVRERPKMVAIWGGEYFRDWRKAGCFVLLSLPSSASAAWNGFVLSRWAWAAFGFVAGELLVFAGFISICSGMASSNWGTYFRETEPVRFWLSVAICGLGYVLVMAGMWLGR